MSTPRWSRVHPAWIVLATTFLVLLGAAGVRAAPSILIVPLERELGWTRVTTSLVVTVNLILYGAMGPFSAALMQRFGVRRTVLASLLLVAVGVREVARRQPGWKASAS